jgi:organic hydroperoxide reductase OsmC/OhrA
VRVFRAARAGRTAVWAVPVGIAFAPIEGMEPFPHRYVVNVIAEPRGDVLVGSRGLASLQTTLPPEFGGSADRWSPETLVVAAVADCYALTFRGLAARSNLPWVSLTCEVGGTLDRAGQVTKFTRFRIEARLRVPEHASADLARRLLAKAEATCLITRSMSAEVLLDAVVEQVAPQAA